MSAVSYRLLILASKTVLSNKLEGQMLIALVLIIWFQIAIILILIFDFVMKTVQLEQNE
jgi:hypothetical protein